MSDNNLPTFTIRQMMEAGVHFGHHTRRWNPKMKPYIYGVRQGIHILDLDQTSPMLYKGMEAVREVVKNGGRVLFVGTKRQAQEKIAETAKRCGQFYVNHRWLGGMLTNFKTISQAIGRLREIEKQLAEKSKGLTKREMLQMTREHDKLELSLGGIKDMGGLPDIMFVIDTNREQIAIKEANRLGIPVVAILDTNSDPDNIDFPVPGNDDASRAINFYCDMIAGSVIGGIQAEMQEAGVDIGELADAPGEAKAEEAKAE